jgi:hypothetical protein
LRATRGFLGAPKPRGETFTGEIVTDATEVREAMNAEIIRARDTRNGIAERQDGAAEFFRADDERRRELLEAVAHGEADAAELGITDDESSWPDEWCLPL